MGEQMKLEITRVKERARKGRSGFGKQQKEEEGGSKRSMTKIERVGKCLRYRNL